MQLDPATDSGTPGDEFTSFSPVNLIGSTSPSQQIFLDTDGDGFDDGTVTADETGQFRFDSIPLVEGTTEIEIQTPSVAGVAELKQAFTIDTQPVSSTLAVPTAAQIVDDGRGYVDLQWTDVGSGPDAATYDAADITISGVTVDRAEVMGGGLVRYWYDEHVVAAVVAAAEPFPTDRSNKPTRRESYFARLASADVDLLEAIDLDQLAVDPSRDTN